ncbi:hypothetical protein FPZ43_04515 [Mucilaginibacter pallidiroseus]|uniref:Uncharacterized protein n=1 Tax=Mucilaginibacter pallidiroseus TaxID=2599295 RepID=A0A563UFR4_9SPHI|nr:hypothetical protein [Mucilaginibacter pallidiroseus]TWR30212.1 hypothetical protein FPZ43_04515 [Mucilaginibacter pallidiroseus]
MRNILDVAPSLAEYFIDVEQIISDSPPSFDDTNNILGKYRQYLASFMLIVAAKVSLFEHQDNDWQSIFGHEFDVYYHCFKSKIQEGVYLSDQSICANLIDEIDGKSA